MKPLLLATCGTLLFAGSAPAGRVNVYAGGYGCAPRFHAPPVYGPRVITYCPPPVYYRPAPVYCSPAPAVVYFPSRAPIYRAPIITGGVSVSTVSFGWRR